MRNLKRVLALALALVMVIGMMVIGASAASTTEYDYSEAVAVITGSGIMVGDENGDLMLEETLTREVAAKIMAYVMLGGKTAEKLVAKTQNFSDVPTTRWSAKFIEYCVNTGLIAGRGDGSFDPEGELTGIAFAKLLLTAAGYDADAEGYVGDNWATAIAVDAMAEGLDLDEVTLYDTINRQQAAQMLLNIMDNETVYYHTSFDKATGAETVSGPYGEGISFGQKLMGIVKVGGDHDVWGRPYSYQWIMNGRKALYTAWETPIATYTTAVTECQLAQDLGLDGNYDYQVPTYLNGKYNVGYTAVNPTDMVGKVGAQGRLIEVYEDRLVVIDTYLAKVTNVVDAKFDAAGHMISDAKLYMDVYDGRDAAMDCYISGGATNFTYKKGEFVLVNAWGVDAARNTNVAVSGTVGAWEAAHLEIVGYANSVVDAQTIIWFNLDQHTIGSTTYPDACQYDLDAAQKTANTKFTWYFDQYGNVIGSDSLKKADDVYAAIANIQWINPVGTAGYAVATLVYMDGSAESVVVDKIGATKLSYSNFDGVPAQGSVSANYTQNAAYIGNALYVVTKNAATGKATLAEVPTKITNAAVTTGNPTIATGVYVDNDTQFLYWTGKEWTPIAGFTAMPTLIEATVYYINSDPSDIVAEYVYLYGKVPAPTIVDASSVVYVNSISYAVVLNDPGYVVLKDAYVNGVLTDVVVGAGLVDPADGATNDLTAKTLYYMTDKTGDGKYKLNDGDEITNLCAANAMAGTAYLPTGSYSFANGALIIAGQTVPYNINNIVLYQAQTWTADQTVVIFYKDYVVSAVYVIA